MSYDIAILAGAFLIVAVLYSSVGHAGATGYLAVMAIAGMSPALMKPTALTLNIIVASIATFKYYKRGAFSWQLFLPLVLASFPFAYLGGRITLPPEYYKPLVGLFLLYAAWRAFATSKTSPTYAIKPVSWPVLIACGAGLGFLSGLTGVGRRRVPQSTDAADALGTASGDLRDCCCIYSGELSLRYGWFTFKRNSHCPGATLVGTHRAHWWIYWGGIRQWSL